MPKVVLPVAPATDLSREVFEERLVSFINETLPDLHSRLKTRPQVDRQTPLFESGLIDSLAILHVLAFVERSTGRPIPPRLVDMRHFRTVAAIGEAFVPDQSRSVPAQIEM